MDHPVPGPTMPDIIAAQVRKRQHRPLLTMYDDMTGTRTELSYATADNWANKTANLLVEEFALSPGDQVAIDLDGHWTGVVLALACWKIGAALQPNTAAPSPVAVVCCHERRAGRHPNGPLLVVGDGLRAEPIGAVDHREGLVLLGEDVHAYADDYDGPAVEPDAPAIATSTATLQHRDVLARAIAWSETLGERPRVAVAVPIDHVAGLALLAGTIVAGGSVVAERPAARPPRWERLASERVTAVAGPLDTLVDPPHQFTVVALDAADEPDRR